MHQLDWTHAFTHRLAECSFASSTFAAKSAALSARLGRELAAGTLPFLNLPFKASLEAALPPLAESLKKFRHMVLLGIGGSALGARALQKAFFSTQDRPGHSGPWLWIADNIDADTLDQWMSALDPRETVVVAVSKSGGTIETMAQYFLMRRWLQASLGMAWKEHVVLVTDERSGELRAEAVSEGLASLPVPDHLGGRYSAISAVGLLPAAFMGMDWRGLLKGAAEVNASLARDPSLLAAHPAFRLALWNRELMDKGYSQLIFFCYIPAWTFFGAWFAQLWAESLGKEGKGSMPVPAVGVTDQHSVNQMFLDGPRDKGCLFITRENLPAGREFTSPPTKWSYLAGKRFGDLLQAEALGTRMALVQSKVPLVRVDMASGDEEAAGRFMGLCMAATVFTGWLLDIDPLDQPAVELGKRLANARLGAPGVDAESAALKDFLEKNDNAAAQTF